MNKFLKKYYFDKFKNTTSDNLYFKDQNITKKLFVDNQVEVISKKYWHYFSVIQMNNTYLDMTDNNYYQKGFGNMMLGYSILLTLSLI